MVSGAAAVGAAAAASTLFLSFWSRSTASAIRASFAFGSACARSMRSRRSASLTNWLLALRAAPSMYVLSADSALGACASDAAALEEPGGTYAQNWLTPPAEREPTNDPSAAAVASSHHGEAERARMPSGRRYRRPGFALRTAVLHPSLLPQQLGPVRIVGYLRTMKLSPGRQRRGQTRPQLPRLHHVADPDFRLGLGLCHPRPRLDLSLRA